MICLLDCFSINSLISSYHGYLLLNNQQQQQSRRQQLAYTRNEMMFIPPMSDAPDVNLVSNSDDHNNNNNNFHIQGGLSLSLGTQMVEPSVPNSFHYNHQYSEPEEDLMIHLPSSTDAVKMEGSMNNGGGGGGHVQAYDPYGYPNVSLLNSKYLNATVDLLDEFVNVKYALMMTKVDEQNKGENKEVKDGDNVSELSGNNSSSSSPELTTSEKQELQNKKAKLVSMIDEVDRRYKQYYHQMQALMSSLDMVAGNGAAKPYTALALQTISRRFRSLRDAIGGQVEVIRRKLGEQLEGAAANGGQGGIPRLRYVEQQLRQQRAIHQQFGGGVMRHSWRPQRGLPENSVSVLRAWLFEHFLHPYPNDAEKLVLAKQTGLSRNQVANWFINARVRLWKPMVEEMYKEECGGAGGGDNSDVNSKSSNDEPNRAHAMEFPNLHELQDTSITSPTSTAAADHHRFLLQSLPSDDHNSIIKFHHHHQDHGSRSEINHEGMHQYVGEEQSTLPFNLNAGDGSLMSAAVQYGGVSDAGLFPGNSHVSLALGLQHNETDNQDLFPGSGAAAEEEGHGLVDEYHCLDGKQQDGHHSRFGNTVNLFHDFVASKNPCF
ncbi:BEL1-like homeodomain protein 10 [Linum perenne]